MDETNPQEPRVVVEFGPESEVDLALRRPDERRDALRDIMERTDRARSCAVRLCAEYGLPGELAVNVRVDRVRPDGVLRRLRHGARRLLWRLRHG